MSKKTIHTIILFTAISLFGLILTQLFWIWNAISVGEEQYDHRVSIALQEVLDELTTYNMEHTTSDVAETTDTSHITCPHSKNPRKEFIDTKVLDSLLKRQFSFHQLDTIYEFAIIECGNRSPLYKKEGTISDKFPMSCHTTGLSCIWQTHCYNLEVYFPDKQKFIILKLLSWLIISVIFLLIVIISFAYIVKVIVKQKKLSEMKNDFINNMTHEFKTPISTISMASEVLLKADEKTSQERLKKYSQVIFDENNRLKLQVERVLEIAQMDKHDFKIDKKDQENVNDIIRKTVDNLCMEHCQRPVDIIYKLNAENPVIKIDRLHFKNVINNLIDNAYKYSGDKPKIEISTHNTPEGVIITVHDNGIGMSTETQKQIFNKFYRLPTGNIHNVKGFGLGLYYVKNIIEQHDGSIKVSSELNRGSRFDIYLPFGNTN